MVSQLLTLYITPVYYVYIEGARQRLIRRREHDVPALDATGLQTGEQQA